MWKKFKNWCFENQQDAEPSSKSIKLGVLMIIPLIFWILSGVITILFWGKPDGAGTFGDMFGSVNALFSGMALAGIVYTIFIQKKEFQLQRLELKDTRKVFVTQRFENTFFNLITLYKDVVENITYQDPYTAETLRGRPVFERIYDRLYHALSLTDDEMTFEMTFEERLEFYLGSQYSHFEHYVNYFDWIVTFVYQNEEIDQSTKINYYHTLKAQLSSYERLILFYIVILTQNAKFAMKVVHVLSISELERKLVDVHHIDIYDQIFNKNFEVKESS